MLEVLNKYKKGTKIQIGQSKAIVTSDLIKFREFFAIYADVVENVDSRVVCGTYKIHDRIALIIRDKKRLLEMRFNCGRKKSHILS